MYSPQVQRSNPKTNAIYYKCFWADDDTSVSETDFEGPISAREYVDRILKETELDSRPVSCQHLPGLHLSLDLLAELLSRSTPDVCSRTRQEAIERRTVIDPDSAQAIVRSCDDVQQPSSTLADYPDSGYVELLTSASCNFVNASENVHFTTSSSDAEFSVPLKFLSRKPEAANVSGPVAEVDLECNPEEFFIDDEFESFPAMLASSSDCWRHNSAATVKEKNVTNSTDDMSSDDDTAWLCTLPSHTGPEVNTFNADILLEKERISRQWRRRWRGMKVFVGVVTLIAGLGTLSSIAYLLLNFVIFA